ncbi:5447_t:CDS:2, partial [Gigaspora margarita]
STPSRNLGSNQPTEADSKTRHIIRMNVTNNKINELHNLIEELENSFIAKYHDRTTEQRFDNPDSWLIEINRLEHEASSIPQALADLRRQTVKESAQALEAQLNVLHEQIQEKKSNKSLRQ